jgi:hypothetical protein
MWQEKFRNGAALAAIFGSTFLGSVDCGPSHAPSQDGLLITSAAKPIDLRSVTPETEITLEQYINRYDELFEKIAKREEVIKTKDALGSREAVNYMIPAKKNVTLNKGMAKGDYAHLEGEIVDPEVMRNYRFIAVEEFSKDKLLKTVTYYQIISGLAPHVVVDHFVKIKDKYEIAFEEVDIFDPRQMKKVIDTESYDYDALPKTNHDSHIA